MRSEAEAGHPALSRLLSGHQVATEHRSQLCRVLDQISELARTLPFKSAMAQRRSIERIGELSAEGKAMLGGVETHDSKRQAR